ncbi:hypothetical protein PR002_g3519 [Phytophthora rubi]|uniref:Uncharacterized protein n=1 Tax=Phytophthora rubi TaxID=129364 RepID=A0A6A3NPY5_9STRA|nr:hypothetical protein PR002_g3519 [Phytophthora rubi]
MISAAAPCNLQLSALAVQAQRCGYGLLLGPNQAPLALRAVPCPSPYCELRKPSFAAARFSARGKIFAAALLASFLAPYLACWPRAIQNA